MLRLNLIYAVLSLSLDRDHSPPFAASSSNWLIKIKKPGMLLRNTSRLLTSGSSWVKMRHLLVFALKPSPHLLAGTTFQQMSSVNSLRVLLNQQGSHSMKCARANWNSILAVFLSNSSRIPPSILNSSTSLTTLTMSILS
jgi:hypothetical protein